MPQQLPERNRMSIRLSVNDGDIIDDSRWQITVNGIIQTELTILHELQDEGGDKSFSDTADTEFIIGLHGNGLSHIRLTNRAFPDAATFECNQGNNTRQKGSVWII
jgi:hypothetical protein